MDPYGEDLVAQVTRFLADQRADEAAAARTREHWLRQMASEDGTFAGALLDLAEQRRAVVVATTSGRRHRGAVRAVGLDFCVVAGAHGQVLVSRRAVTSVRAETGPGPAVPAGDRTVAVGAELVTTLAGLAADRPRAMVVTLAGEVLAGELRSVNTDSLSLRLDGDGAVALVPADAIAEFSLA